VVTEACDPDELFAKIAEQTNIELLSPEVWKLSTPLFKLVTQLEAPTGWGLLLPIPEAVLASNIGSADGDGRPGAQENQEGLTDHWVVADRLQDPGNLGALMRTAAAAGIRYMVCLKGTVDPWSPKVLRSAMGAHFVMQIENSIESDQFLAQVSKLGLRLMSTANQPKALSIYSDELHLDGPIAWVFGQEGDGVSETILSISEIVKIPQSEDVESLNVAVAAGICLFEALRRSLPKG
jgi:tRNA G18 (ribose-2'-O)-methylase SpoU